MSSYPGASPQVVEERVTTPIEQAVLSLQGLEGRLWMTVYGVIAVILTQAIQSILQFAEKGV